MILFASLGYLASVYLGWWIVPIWSLAMGYFLSNGLKGLGQIFVSIVLVWSLMAYYQDGQNLGFISIRLSEMLQIPRVLTYILSGLVGAFIAMPAYLLGDNLRNLRSSNQ